MFDSRAGRRKTDGASQPTTNARHIAPSAIFIIHLQFSGPKLACLQASSLRLMPKVRIDAMPFDLVRSQFIGFAVATADGIEDGFGEIQEELPGANPDVGTLPRLIPLPVLVHENASSEKATRNDRRTHGLGSCRSFLVRPDVVQSH